MQFRIIHLLFLPPHTILHFTYRISKEIHTFTSGDCWHPNAFKYYSSNLLRIWCIFHGAIVMR